MSRCQIILWEKAEPIPRSELLSRIRGVNAVYCILTDKIDEEILEAAGPQLQVVASMSVGIDHLDLNALKKRDIRIGYTPDVLTDATAELIVALLLATSRRLLEANRAIYKYFFSLILNRSSLLHFVQATDNQILSKNWTLDLPMTNTSSFTSPTILNKFFFNESFIFKKFTQNWSRDIQIKKYTISCCTVLETQIKYIFFIYRSGEWKAWAPTWMCGPGLSGSTVGIVGLGRIGLQVGKCLKSFNVARLLYTSRTAKPEASKFCGQKVELNELLRESDFVVVTTTLTSETRHMFNAEAFKQMKNTAIFVNGSRGEVVDQVALIDALKSKTIAAAGLDVMTPEPISLDSELLKLNNCG